MGEIVGVEFDRYKFDSPGECEKWIRSQPTHTDLQVLLDRKTFRLKSGSGVFLSDERRKVWCWYAMWDCKQFVMQRPTQNVVIIKKIASQGTWDALDLPLPLPSTQEKRAKVEHLRQKREFKRRELLEKNRQKRKTGAKNGESRPAKKPRRPIPRKVKEEAPALPSSPILPPVNLTGGEVYRIDGHLFPSDRSVVETIQ